MIEDIFNFNDYMVLGRNVREVRVWSKDLDRLEVIKVWTFHGSSHPLLNDILNTMRCSGWTLEISVDGGCIFSRPRYSSGLKENSPAQERIIDDEDDMTLSQLVTCQIGNNNDITTGILSTNDYNMRNSDESDRLDDDTKFH